MTRILILAGLFLLAITPAVFAHPGHPTLNPHHTHGVLDPNPVALILLAAIAIGVILVGRGAVRPRNRRSRIGRK